MGLFWQFLLFKISIHVFLKSSLSVLSPLHGKCRIVYSIKTEINWVTDTCTLCYMSIVEHTQNPKRHNFGYFLALSKSPLTCCTKLSMKHTFFRSATLTHYFKKIKLTLPKSRERRGRKSFENDKTDKIGVLLAIFCYFVSSIFVWIWVLLCWKSYIDKKKILNRLATVVGHWNRCWGSNDHSKITGT